MKTEKTESVVHDWVSELPFTQQAVLFTAVRGPDSTSKVNPAKVLTHYLRGAVLKPAYKYNPADGFRSNGFMCGDYSNFSGHSRLFVEDHDNYAHHYIMHLVHAAEIIGYHHPDPYVSMPWFLFYCSMCEVMHMHPESIEQMNERLSK